MVIFCFVLKGHKLGKKTALLGGDWGETGEEEEEEEEGS